MHVRDGYRMTELGEIPVDWKVENLGQLGHWYGGGTPSKANSEYWENGKIGWVTSQDAKQKFITSTTSKITEIAVKESSSKMTTPFSLLMVMRSGILKHTFPVAIAVHPVAINQDIKVLSPFESVSHEYVYQFLQLMNKDIVSNLVKAGTTVQSVEYDQLKKYLIPLPPLLEQQQIADILSTLDEHISETESLIEKTKVLKQGMMQNLLTKGIGHTEFKDTEVGRIPAEWKVVAMAALGSTYGGLSGKSKDDFGEGSPFITYKSIFDSSIVDLSRVEYVQIKMDEHQNKAQKGDLFFTTSSETPDEVGMCSALLAEVDNLYLNSFCFGYRIFDRSVFDSNFARYLFRGSSFRTELSKLAQGSTRFNLSKNAMLKTSIPLPTLFEQQKIAAILTTIDDQIDALQTKLAILTKLKSALMQQLLTGKIRVKI